ncbi:hypothetical protein MHU86_17027 [Fragilaria crotonensis]|nr:hypothetical protein MHU86_17027 [Fragilaria crotonensis]
MLRQRLQCFLVAALLVNVISEPSRNCSICGDGYEVGSPYVRTSLSCSDPVQGSSATLCTCKDLEIAGLQGLISECSIVSLVIFEACHCQENTSQNTWFPTSSPSLAPFAPIAPVVPTYYPVASPLSLRPATNFPTPALAGSISPVAPNYYPVASPVLFLPATNAPTPAPAGDQLFALLFFVIFSVCFFGPCICACVKTCMQNGGAGVCRRWCVYHAPSRYGEGTQQNFPTIPVSTPTVPIGNARSRRPLVLAALFPREGRLESDEHSGGRGNLKYDPQSKHYVFCEDAPDAVSCSICMEFLVPTDDTVTGLCSHTYHRECVMNWLQGGHDECPNCRQLMWDPETYEMVDECIKNGDCFSPFAV